MSSLWITVYRYCRDLHDTKQALMLMVCAKLLVMVWHILQTAKNKKLSIKKRIVAHSLFLTAAILSLLINWTTHASQRRYNIQVMFMRTLIASEVLRVVTSIGAQVLILVMLDWNNPYLVCIEMLFTAMALMPLVSLLWKLSGKIRTHVT